MLREFCVLLILSTSQSLAVLSNAQQDLAIKPIVYKPATNQYVTANIQEVSTTNTDIQQLQPQYQSTFIQNSAPYNYNQPNHQFSTIKTNEEVTTTPRSYISSSNQYQSNSTPSNFNRPLYQYYPNSPQEVVTTTSKTITPLAHPTNFNQYQTQYVPSSNYNRPSNQLPNLPQQHVLTTPRSNIPSTSSSYYGPAYQYLPGPAQSLQTTTPLPNTFQNTGNSENFPNNHKTHWSPVVDTRPQESTTNHVPSNIQPPIELHHGYRYIEPALKVNSSNFQTINGVIYNELGLGQNETNTTQKPQPFVPQNPLPSKTEIETQHGYVYENTQHNPHYPNTTVLIPVQTSMDTYKYYQPYQNQNSNNQNFNRQQLETHEKQSQQSSQHSQNLNQQQLKQQHKESSLSQEQSTQTFQHQNNRFGSSNQNLNNQPQTTSQEQFLSLQYPNHKFHFSNSNSQENSQTSQLTKPENSPSTNNRPSSQTENGSGYINRQPSSQPGLLPHSNNIASPQSNRYTTEVTQQLATQIYPNIHSPSQTTSNQYYTHIPHENSAVVSELRPSNDSKRPQSTDSSNYIQTNPSNSNGSNGIPSNSQYATQERPANYGTLNKAPQSLDHSQQFIENQTNNPNIQPTKNQYSQTNSHYNSQTNPQIQHISTDFINRQPLPSAASNNVQTQSNRFDTSGPLKNPDFHQNLQNGINHNYYLTNSQPNSQFATASNTRLNPETQSHQFETTETQQSSLPNYSSNQNPQNSGKPLSSSLPHVQTESYQGHRNPPSLSSSYNRPNEQNQANQYESTQHTLTPISFANQNQQQATSLQTETNQHYSTNKKPESNQFQTFYPQQEQQTVSSSHQHPQSSLTKPSQNPYNIQTESNQHFITSPPSNIITQSSSSSNMQPELNKYFASYSQPQNTLGNPLQNPTTNFALNPPTESNHYLYNKPELTHKIPESAMSSNTLQHSNVQTHLNRLPAQSSYHPQSTTQPLTQSESSNSPPLGNPIIFPIQPPSLSPSQNTFSSTSLNSNNPSASLSETPRYTPSRQLFSQNFQQSFLGKPSPTFQVSNTNAISDIFGQTSAISATAHLPALSNVNIIPPTSDGPITIPMGNTNYLQMQSQSFELPYYYNKPPQKPISVEPVRLPHLTYGSPLRESHNSLPSVIMKPPYYKK